VESLENILEFIKKRKVEPIIEHNNVLAFKTREDR